MSTPNGTVKDTAGVKSAAEVKSKTVRPVVSTGNPRVTVAFPFSKIDINEPSAELRDLSALVAHLAEQTAQIVSQVAPDQAEAADSVAAQAALLSQRLNPVS